MKKALLLLLMIMVISIVACKPVQKEITQTQTGDSVVDAVGNDLNNVDTVDKDLSTDNVGDVDSGLNDVQNI